MVHCTNSLKQDRNWYQNEGMLLWQISKNVEAALEMCNE